MTIIITYDGYESQCETGKGNTDKKHGTLHDCQCTHIDITECLQWTVQHKSYQAFGTCHNKRWGSQRQYSSNNLPVQPHITRLEPQRSTPGCQKEQYPASTASLRNNSGKRSSFHSPIKDKNKQRIEQDIKQRSNNNRQHSDAGTSLCINKSIQPDRDFDKKGTDKINRKISRCVPERLFRSTGKQKNRFHKQIR